jgi:hypothetical protein
LSRNDIGKTRNKHAEMKEDGSAPFHGKLTKLRGKIDAFRELARDMRTARNKAADVHSNDDASLDAASRAPESPLTHNDAFADSLQKRKTANPVA